MQSGLKAGIRTLSLLLGLAIVPRSEAQQSSSPPVNRLKESVQLTINSVNASWGIYVKSLATGEELAINADVEMESMSTIKLPLMIEVMQQVKAGKFKLSDKYTLKQADIQGGTGTIQFMDPGAVLTVKDLVTHMVVVSDNTATEVLYRMVGGITPVNDRMKALGLTHTRAMNIPSVWFAAFTKLKEDQWEPTLRQKKMPFGITTPREMAKLLEMLEKKTLVDTKSSELMLSIMRNQVYRTRIPRYLGYTYDIPHKTGDFPPFIANDVGIVEAPGANIVMSIFTANHTGRYDVLENAVGLVAQDARNYFVYRAK